MSEAKMKKGWDDGAMLPLLMDFEDAMHYAKLAGIEAIQGRKRATRQDWEDALEAAIRHLQAVQSAR